MPKPQKFCIYCGGPKLTKEHLWPDWLQPFLETRVDRHGINISVVWPSHTTSKVAMRDGDSHSRKIRRVCGECNSGWMSQLQTSAKPLLLPMIRGETTVLSRSEQKIVAAWAAMTAMSSEFVDDEFVAIPQEDRDLLREHLRVPRGWRIWVGRYRWAQGVERWTHHVFTLAEDGYQGPAGELGHPMNTQTTTICVGNHLVVHVMSSSVGPGQRIIRLWNFPKALGVCLRQIHPAAASSIRWPPPHVLEPRELHYVANTLFDRMQRLLIRQTS